jgi:uncharacterized protein
MTAAATAAPPLPQPWGYLATLAWALLAAVVSVVASALVARVWYADRLDLAQDLMTDGELFSSLTVVSTVAQVAALALAARLARWGVADYLGFTIPNWRETALGLACIAAFVLGSDALTYIANRDIVSSFQTDTFRSARESGSLPLLWLTFVLVGPAGEEATFRGFLFRGWARSPRAVLPAIVAISAIWAVIHVQYDWFGIVQIFLSGLLLGWIRWRSGSALLTLLLHGVMNAWATVETIIKLDWLS